MAADNIVLVGNKFPTSHYKLVTAKAAKTTYLIGFQVHEPTKSAMELRKPFNNHKA